MPGRYTGLLEGAAAGSPGRGLLLTVERQTEGMRGRRLRWEMPVKESRAAMEASDTAESCIVGGAITITSLSPHASISS